jgi:hypothetical protein
MAMEPIKCHYFEVFAFICICLYFSLKKEKNVGLSSSHTDDTCHSELQASPSTAYNLRFDVQSVKADRQLTCYLYRSL